MTIPDGSILHYLANVIDILVVWFVIYKLIMLIRGTKAVQLLKGIFIIVVVKIVSSFFRTADSRVDYRSGANLGIFSHYYYIPTRITPSA